MENDSRDLEANWAPSDFDRPHRFSASAVWDIAGGGHAVTRDWQVATFMQFQSGRPFSIYAFEAGLLGLAFPAAGLRAGRQRGHSAPARLRPGGSVVQHRRGGARKCGGQHTPRNFIRGPNQARVDLSISKALRLGDRVRAQLRAEIFNLLNRANFDIPEQNIDSTDFGRITRTIGGPRVTQVGLRVTF